jgi:hypothetical protein
MYIRCFISSFREQYGKDQLAHFCSELGPSFQWQ